MAVSNGELLSALQQAGNGPRRVEISASGIWLHANGRAYEIDMNQADALFTTMFGHTPEGEKT